MLTQAYQIREVDPLYLLNDGHDLFVEHREELTTNKDLMVLKPFAAGYQALAEAGALLVLAAYGPNDELIGYSANVIAPNMHYSDLIVCQNDVLFISKAHRGSTVGIRLIRETEIEAARRGCRMMLWHAKPDTALDSILPRLGCKVQDVIYSKVID